VSFTLQGIPRPLPEGAELAAYRVVQESLTNTRKHGGLAAAAAVTLRYETDDLVVQVTDDGLGAAAVTDGAGHGLTGMRERIELYGGTIQAGPLPTGGYQVTARLPCPQQPHPQQPHAPRQPAVLAADRRPAQPPEPQAQQPRPQAHQAGQQAGQQGHQAGQQTQPGPMSGAA